MSNEEYFLLIQGETRGPYSMAQLQELWHNEDVPVDTLYVRPGMPQCRPLDELLNKVIAYHPAQPAKTAPAEDEIQPERRMVMSWMVIAMALTAMALVYGVRARPKPEPPAAPDLGFGITLSHLEVTNRGKYPMYDRIITLNSPVPDAFRHRLKILYPGIPTKVPLIDFVDSKGHRFEPWTMTTDRVWVGDGKGPVFEYRLPIR